MSSCKTSNSNIINVENEKSKSFPFVPYSITRNVMKQEELEHVAGYDRYKESRKLISNFKYVFLT